MKSLRFMLAGIALACLSLNAQAQCCYNSVGWSGSLTGTFNSQVTHLDAGPSWIVGLLPQANLDWSGASTAGNVLTANSVGGPTFQPPSSPTPPDFGSPTARTLSLATAYQASTTTKPATVVVNLTSNASLTLGGGTTNTAIIVIGPTTGVASGTGTTVGTYSNSLTGTLIVGIAISTVSTAPISFSLPKGWYFAIIQQTGTVTINSAFDQSLG